MSRAIFAEITGVATGIIIILLMCIIVIFAVILDDKEAKLKNLQPKHQCTCERKV